MKIFWRVHCSFGLIFKVDELPANTSYLLFFRCFLFKRTPRQLPATYDALRAGSFDLQPE